ncbi:MAG: hypothetical protein HRF47_09390 [Chloroflexota bacterium]|jgi:hypothetical protein
MCLQWCHVRSLLIDNDLPCALWCPDEVRLAQQGRRCAECRHHRAGICALTHERTPLAQTCCHFDAPVQPLETVRLKRGETVPEQLLRAHGIQTVAELFLVVDSAPDLPQDAQADEIRLDARLLSVPLVYGVRARCWDKALYGADPYGWCDETENDPA